MSCKTVEPAPIILIDPPIKPQIIEITDLNTALQQINILIIQEFKWRIVYLDNQWILGLISDEERETEKQKLLKLIDKLTNK